MGGRASSSAAWCGKACHPEVLTGLREVRRAARSRPRVRSRPRSGQRDGHRGARALQLLGDPGPAGGLGAPVTPTCAARLLPLRLQANAHGQRQLLCWERTVRSDAHVAVRVGNDSSHFRRCFSRQRWPWTSETSYESRVPPSPNFRKKQSPFLSFHYL